jgi:hypothetical protein
MKSVRIQILTAASLKLAAFWDIVPCSPVEVDGRFRGAYSITLKMNRARTSETSVYFRRTTRRCIPEGCHLNEKYLI